MTPVSYIQPCKRFFGCKANWPRQQVSLLGKQAAGKQSRPGRQVRATNFLPAGNAGSPAEFICLPANGLLVAQRLADVFTGAT
jgi:hypothetical protein